MKKNADWIRRRFGEPGDFLGCGAWGCAWKLGSEVLKITTDPSEAANVARLSGQALISGVVETRKLCRAPGDAGLWVYLREYIEPFTSTDLKKLKRYEDLTALGHIQQAGWKWLRAKGARRTRYVDDYLNWVKILRPELPLVADAMAELWRREKLLLADVHLGNIGWALRDGDYEVVICDLGQSSKLAGRGVEWIERCQA